MNKPTPEQLAADVAFLLPRAAGCGRFSCDERNRDFGMSSNSIVAIAYGIESLANQIMPGDKYDFMACSRMWDKLPEHRKTTEAKEALLRASKAI